MAIISQRELFNWEHIEAASDLDRLTMVLNAIPDEHLMQVLEAERKGRRDDYPIRAVWNSVLAGVVFQHKGLESLRRELSRNGQLRDRCGLVPYKGGKAVPPPYVYTRFLAKLVKHQREIDAMLDELVETLRTLLPGLGTRMAADSKAVDSHGKPPKQEQGTRDADHRRDNDADWGKKTYRGTRENGSLWEKVKSWFGYKIHLLVDSDYELPVAYEVTKASQSDMTHLLPLVEQAEQKHPQLLENTEFLSADKGYDSEENNKVLWDSYGIKPIVDIRDLWKEEPGMPRPLFPDKVDTIFYTEDGKVLCRNRDDAQKERDNYAAMAFEGFEADRETLKYRCPAIAKGIVCTQADLCNGGCQSPCGRIIRIALETNRRTFTPQARDSKTWQREYDHRTAVERVNSRLDVSFGFERHYIRGLAKMKMRAGLALVIMLAMAVGRIRAGQKDQMRSLVQPSR
jgi:hypothetical protein